MNINDVKSPPDSHKKSGGRKLRLGYQHYFETAPDNIDSSPL